MSIGEKIQKIAGNTQDAKAPFKGVYARLISVSPITFRIDMKLDVKKKFIIFPKGVNFTIQDIGKKYLFLKDYGGQQYFFMYEVEEE